MAQIITKLSERRALKKAAKTLNASHRILSSLSQEEIDNMEAKWEGQTPTEVAQSLAKEYIADEVRDYMRGFDFFTEENIAAVTGEHIEELLAGMVEGDDILDNAEVHAFHRRKLDELRDIHARIEGAGPPFGDAKTLGL